MASRCDASSNGARQKLGGPGAQRLQNRVGIVLGMQAPPPAPAASGRSIKRMSSVATSRSVARSSRMTSRLQLADADLQRLRRRITLQIRQNLKRAGLRQRGHELLRQVAIGRDQEGGDLRVFLDRCAHLRQTSLCAAARLTSSSSSRLGLGGLHIGLASGAPGNSWGRRFPACGSLGPSGWVTSGVTSITSSVRCLLMVLLLKRVPRIGMAAQERAAC